jgi:hypothetical protein
MTSAPPDLLGLRSQLQGITGLSAVQLGIVGDVAHAARGGYHMAKPHVSAGSDYSTTLTRDRNGLSGYASALDIGYKWPKGGSPAWLRFNNTLAAQLRTNNILAAVRAINYSPDGKAKIRIDRQNGFANQSTSDTVDVHTHIEWYRDTEGNRSAGLNYIAQIAQSAVSNSPIPPSPSTPKETDVPFLAQAGSTPGTTTQYYLCDGFRSATITKDRATLLAYIATSSYGSALTFGRATDGKDNPEWTYLGNLHGIVRMGWNATFGPAVADNAGNFGVTMTDEQIDVIATKVADAVSEQTGLSYDDTVKAAQQALREGGGMPSAATS